MWTRLALVVLGVLLMAACGTESARDQPAPAATGAPSASAATVRLYTSVTEDTVDAVVAAYQEAVPGATVEVFRAPTGELTARVAAERREGGIRADVLWLTDPLSMQQYEADGLLAPVPAAAEDVVAPEYRSDTFVGTRILNMVIVARDDLDPAPSSWSDLADPRLRDAVAIPDPSFAGSAFGALGYFAGNDDFGLDYYRQLADNGAVQVSAPDDVTVGVAEGRYAAGMTLDNSARTAVENGSPITLIAPEPGAIAIYSPIAILTSAADPEAATAFVDFVLTEKAQAAIANTGWEPIRDDVAWPHDLPQVAPDWAAIFDQQEPLLEEYRAVFGG
ncbi:MAG: extracellular solute-binding protein [Actinomycetota bacterium]|nr:extracellular solute-binding protein [Actinomycetota bacterium]